MTDVNSSAPWHQRRRYQVLIVVAALSLLGWGHRLYKEFTMPPILVYLIAEDFFGPIFVFFDQPDGVMPEPDPLGQAVRVPENGVVKLRGSASSLVRSLKYGKRAEAMVEVQKNGSRRIMSIFAGTLKDEDGETIEAFIDGNDKAHIFPVFSNPKTPSNAKEKLFYYLSPAQMGERMVSLRDGCRHQGFVPHSEKIASGELGANEAGVPGCGKFLIASPNEKLSLPKWLWETTGWPYDSVEEFIKEADERLKKRKLLVQNQTK